MFDIAFHAVNAFDQLAFLTGGLICLGIALLIIAAEIQTRMRCAKVSGRIVAVRCTAISSPDRSEAATPPAEPVKDFKSFSELFRQQPGVGMLALFFAAVVILVPLTFIGTGAYFGWSYFDLKANGVETEAKVLRIDRHNSRKNGTTYTAVVALKDANGKTIESREKVSTGAAPDWRKGDAIKVFYNPVKPQSFVVDDDLRNLSGGIGIAAMGVGVLFFIFGWPHVRDHLKKIKKPSDAPKRISMTEAAGCYYYPVYEYAKQNGEIARVNSTSGSNLLGNKIPGTAVTLFVDPEEPWEAHDSGIGVTAIVAGMLQIPAVAFLYVALFQYDFNLFTWFFSVLLLGYYGVKIAGSIKPRDQWETPSGFKQRRREKRRLKAENPPGRILSNEEFRERLEALDRYNLLLSHISAVIGCGLLIGGYYLDSDATLPQRIFCYAGGALLVAWPVRYWARLNRRNERTP